ncbi:hypothetical protein BDV38DRAFT_243490 [Aspergillus pseudotamarii]|uniref:Uncharacterized protein n=1 Tax=Aspergillus pseudotamarii TaxID=132259 RepID=A0A5N6SZ31_ASPPS|nr:uncharacterized protein BDV38DRAFT_243490 [Aspergillus pseudotamarii]KAE8139039.1 hypothetical protein BDV38DRAFT_243490 [Aspergillus pseudotamarii]
MMLSLDVSTASLTFHIWIVTALFYTRDNRGRGTPPDVVFPTANSSMPRRGPKKSLETPGWRRRKRIGPFASSSV